jgi:hypothetical protein
MGGIREFNCACLIVSLVLALLLNTSRSCTLLRIICLVSTLSSLRFRYGISVGADGDLTDLQFLPIPVQIQLLLEYSCTV